MDANNNPIVRVSRYSFKQRFISVRYEEGGKPEATNCSAPGGARQNSDPTACARVYWCVAFAYFLCAHRELATPHVDPRMTHQLGTAGRPAFPRV